MRETMTTSYLGIENPYRSPWRWLPTISLMVPPLSFEHTVQTALMQIKLGIFGDDVAQDSLRGGNWIKGPYADPYRNGPSDEMITGRMFKPVFTF